MGEESALLDGFIHWLSAPTSLVSFFCSAAICYHVLKHPKRQCYHRLLVGLSFFDMSSSSTIFVARFLNIHTPGPKCTAIGMTQMWAVGSATWYNVCLSYMFLVIVRYELREDFLVKWCEPPAHLISSLSPIALAVAGDFLQIWNPVSFSAVCWIGKYPTLCEGDECQRGGEWFLFYDHFIHGLFYLAVILMAVANFLIYRKVRSTLHRNRRYSGRYTLRHRQSDPRLTKVAVRSFLFCGGYFITYVFSIVQSKLETSYGTWWYATIAILSSIFWPLQGFFDAAIFFFPRYTRWKRLLKEPGNTHNNSSSSTWLALYMTIFTTLPPTPDSKPKRQRRQHRRRRRRRRRQSQQPGSAGNGADDGSPGDDDDEDDGFVLDRNGIPWNSHRSSTSIPRSSFLWNSSRRSALFSGRRRRSSLQTTTRGGQGDDPYDYSSDDGGFSDDGDGFSRESSGSFFGLPLTRRRFRSAGRQRPKRRRPSQQQQQDNVKRDEQKEEEEGPFSFPKTENFRGDPMEKNESTRAAASSSDNNVENREVPLCHHSSDEEDGESLVYQFPAGERLPSVTSPSWQKHSVRHRRGSTSSSSSRGFSGTSVGRRRTPSSFSAFSRRDGQTRQEQQQQQQQQDPILESDGEKGIDIAGAAISSISLAYLDSSDDSDRYVLDFQDDSEEVLHDSISSFQSSRRSRRLSSPGLQRTSQRAPFRDREREEREERHYRQQSTLSVETIEAKTGDEGVTGGTSSTDRALYSSDDSDRHHIYDISRNLA